jgi:hypothetical protein
MRSLVGPFIILVLLGVIFALLLIVVSLPRPTATAPKPEIVQPINYGYGVYLFPTVTGIGMEEQYGKELSVFLGAHPELACASGGSITSSFVLTQFLICRPVDKAANAQDETVP